MTWPLIFVFDHFIWVALPADSEQVSGISVRAIEEWTLKRSKINHRNFETVHTRKTNNLAWSSHIERVVVVFATQWNKLIVVAPRRSPSSDCYTRLKISRILEQPNESMVGGSSSCSSALECISWKSAHKRHLVWMLAPDRILIIVRQATSVTVWRQKKVFSIHDLLRVHTVRGPHSDKGASFPVGALVVPAQILLFTKNQRSFLFWRSIAPY